MRTRQQAAALIALAIGALALTACTVSGTPKTANSSGLVSTNESTSTSAESSSSLSGVEACSLLSATDIAEYDLINEKAKVQAGDSICSWSLKGKNQGLTIGVQARTGTGDLNFSGRQTERISIGKYSGIRSITPTSLTRCTIFVEVSDTSTIDITTNNPDVDDDTTVVCDRATRLAESIASRLP
ncbi:MULTISPECIES: DUF3558 family protein [Actinosynnema]|uniref:DUF3558 family protein n=1 Tax=Actinosynnema TaxID=40566 RepID=UPI0020A4B973|nr:DUF3558 family protein [Actinosynnema pretiosum]MCP2099254.1 Protein of unknown function (DUF3558) [Actinosynnema pretiosum]